MRHGTSIVPPGPEIVLIVEDEAPIAEVLAEIVTEAGYRALVAHNGRGGLTLAETEHPALIFTDLMMPYLDGAGFIAAFREHENMKDADTVPIVVMTAAGRSAAASLRYDALLIKPFDIREVERLLHRFLNKGDRDALAAHRGEPSL